jgi:hypothetical protein
MRQHLIYHTKLWKNLYDYVEQEKNKVIKYTIRKDWKTTIWEWEKIGSQEEFESKVKTLVK